MSVRLFRSIYRKGFVAAALTCLLCLLTSAWMSGAIAHSLEQSYLYFQIDQDAIDVRAEINVRDLNEALNLGLEDRPKIPRREIEPYLEQIKDYVTEHTVIGDGSQTYNLAFQDYRFLTTTFARFMLLDYSLVGVQTVPEALEVTYNVILPAKAGHTNLVLIEQNWQTGTFANEANASLFIAASGQTQTLAIPAGNVLWGTLGVARLGVAHIFNLKTADHLLFWAAILLPLGLQRSPTGWKPVAHIRHPLIQGLTMVGLFAVVHTATLGLAVMQVATIPPRVVESVTAAAIGLAVVKIFVPVFKGWTAGLVSVFALFHGLGIAPELVKAGAMSQQGVLSVLSANVGVAIAQAAIVAVLVVLLYMIRTRGFYPRYALPVGGVLLGAMSLYWFVEHAFGVNIKIMPYLQGLLGVVSIG